MDEWHYIFYLQLNTRYLIRKKIFFMPLITGLLLGLSTLLFIGPVFFYLLKSSTENGFKAGFFVALGIIIGDIICVFLALYGFGDFFEQPIIQNIFAGVGGALLLLFGINYIFKTKINSKSKEKFKSKKLIIYFLNGFLINFINPFVFAVWFGFYTLNKSKYESESEIIFSLLITLSIIFITDILKAYFAKNLSKYINPQKLKQIFKVFGIIMIGFSIRLFLILLQ
mgnify:FL=1